MGLWENADENQSLIGCLIISLIYSLLIKISTRSVHVGSLSEVSQDTPNYNCTLLSIVTMLNTLHDRYFAGYAQTQTNCNAMFDVCKRPFFEIGAC